MRALDLSAATFGAEFQGASVSIIAERDGGGDGHVNVAHHAAGHDLGAVTIDGDLGRIIAGDARSRHGRGRDRRALDGLFGTFTQTAGGDLLSRSRVLRGLKVVGDLTEKPHVQGDMAFANRGLGFRRPLSIAGKLGAVTIVGTARSRRGWQRLDCGSQHGERDDRGSVTGNSGFGNDPQPGAIGR